MALIITLVLLFLICYLIINKANKFKTIFFDEIGIYIGKNLNYHAYSEIINISYAGAWHPNFKSKSNQIKIRLKTGEIIRFARQYDGLRKMKIDWAKEYKSKNLSMLISYWKKSKHIENAEN